jgi:hypothetical protein
MAALLLSAALEVRIILVRVPANVTESSYVEGMSLSQQEPRLNCIWCENDLQHCHGTALVDVDGAHVCSDDPDCILDVDEHWFVSLNEI